MEQQIIDIFIKNVKGKIFEKKINDNFCGSEGFWLENLFDIKPNCKNEPDINGYELKKKSKTITFGDYSASEYLFSKNKKIIKNTLTRKEFIYIFGNFNEEKKRYSWSGKCVPKYGVWNDNGQILLISKNNDLEIYYNYTKDNRKLDNDKFPSFLQTGNDILIAIWKKEKLEKHINNKFNKKGFVICEKINNKYENLIFGKPFNYEYFLKYIKNKKIIFDSGWK